MATITRYDTASGPRYRVRYRKPDGRQTDKRGFVTKREAQVFAATVEVSKLTGSFVEARAGRVTIGELGQRRLEHRAATLKPSTWRVESSEWQYRVRGEWGRWPVGDVRTSDVEAWIAKLTRQGCGATVVHRCYGILNGILNSAVRDRLITTNPASGVALPKKTPKPRAYLTHVQVEAVAAACDTAEHALIVRFLAYTGLRWGEMAALRVRHLDMLRRRVQVEQSVVVLAGGVEAFTAPKTYERRSVPFPQFLAVDLAQQCEGRGRDDLLFGDGRALRTLHSQRSWLHAAIRAANAAGVAVPAFSPHALRHTAASLAISAGASPKAVQRMLGHSSAAMTLDTYADLFEDDLDAVAAAMHAARVEKCGQSVGKAVLGGAL